MPTIWGSLEQVGMEVPDKRWIQLRAVLPGGAAVRIHAFVGTQTTIARGMTRIDLSILHRGEPVEVTYHQGRNGFMEANTIYAHPDDAAGTEQDGACRRPHTP